MSLISYIYTEWEKYVYSCENMKQRVNKMIIIISRGPMHEMWVGSLVATSCQLGPPPLPRCLPPAGQCTSNSC